MLVKSKTILVSAVLVALTACANTQPSTQTAATVTQSTPMDKTRVAPVSLQQTANKALIDGHTITLEQIMADPDWMGRQPTKPGWSVDGSELVYQQKQVGTSLTDTFAANLNEPEQAEAVALKDLHRYHFSERAVSADKRTVAYKYKDSVYVIMPSGETVQISRGDTSLSQLQFLRDGRLSARSGDQLIAIDLTTGAREQLLSWKFANLPEAVAKAPDYIAEEQIDLIQYIAQKRTERQRQADYNLQLQEANASLVAEPVYFTPDQQLVAVSLSPNGKKAIMVTTDKRESRSATDIMPHYIQEDGRIASMPVRQRVADAKPVNHDVWLIDLESQTKSPLSFMSLPGYNDDVLAEVKTENAKANGESYTVNRLPRDITLLQSWYWSEPSIRWHSSGEHVALMLEAWDNKDRWIATVDFGEQSLVNQHRLHDDAWINYRYNQFGWLNNSVTLFYQSEVSGYAHLYTQEPGKKPVALTQGKYVTDTPVLTDDDQYIYYKANKKHPGIYEVYRVDLSNGTSEAMTDLNGMTDFTLSPDGKSLLLTHSKPTSPPELFIKATDSAQPASQITDTVSEAFKQLPWVQPQVVAIPSSNTDEPIYARVYLPQNYADGEAKRAVVFNHGAGYLQNAHLGWSGYFREFMFHSMLVQQGYVVLDMDYRASAGYGRDWRTAIYRQMGTPEVEDLRDGVNWLVENANVDRNRIGTYGGSYGGFLTFMSMFTAPDLFQAGAALRPVSDWAHYNTPYTSNILNTPDVDPIAYERSSPIYFAEGLQKPLLINAPMVDDNVFFVDVVRLVQRLIELEKENFETAIYPVEPHGFKQPSSWLDEYRRIYKLFETNL